MCCVLSHHPYTHHHHINPQHVHKQHGQIDLLLWHAVTTTGFCGLYGSTILQVLEAILDDDADMADMYLARRAQLAATAVANATQQRADIDKGASTPDRPGVILFPPFSTVPLLAQAQTLSNQRVQTVYGTEDPAVGKMD